MRLSAFTRRAALAICGLALTALSGCNDQPTIPDPVKATETLTGVVKVGGSDSKTFTVNYQYQVSDAAVTVTAITNAAQAALDTTIGVGFGRIGFDGSCARDANYTATAAKVNQRLVASGVFVAGVQYCVQVFDGGALVEDVNYTLSLEHF